MAALELGLEPELVAVAVPAVPDGFLAEPEGTEEPDDEAGLKPTVVFEPLKPFVPLAVRPEELTQ